MLSIPTLPPKTYKKWEKLPLMLSSMIALHNKNIIIHDNMKPSGTTKQRTHTQPNIPPIHTPNHPQTQYKIILT